MIFTVDALIAHAVGDYVLQSNWMATEKVRRSVACLAHVATYVLPFLFLTRDPRALAFIGGTHFVIDRWRLARYVVWAKNALGPWRRKVTFIDAVDWFDRDTTDNPPGVSLGAKVAASHHAHVWTNPAGPWHQCNATGYGPGVPPWLAGWLTIIVDNLLHVGLNAVALTLWS